MNPVTRALGSATPLTHALLSDLGKGALRDYLRRPELPNVFAKEVVPLWSKLVLTARSPGVIDKHVTAASNVLCVFLSEGISSNTPQFREFVLSKESWWEAFQCAHKAFDDGKTKPAFQILEALCHILQQMTAELINELLNRSAIPLLTTLTLASPRSDVKKACLMLACMVRKTPIKGLLPTLTDQILEHNGARWTYCLSSHNISTEDVRSLGHGSMVSFLFALIFAMIDLDTRTSALKLYSCLCSDQNDNSATSSLQSLGEQTMKSFLARNHATLGYFAENVLPAILSDKERFLVFIKTYTCSCQEDETKMSIFLAALKVGRSKNILSEDEMLEILNAAIPDLTVARNKQTDKYHPFRYLLTLSSSELRILAYGLMAVSPAANAVVSRGTLNSVSFGLKYLHDDADAHERGEILSITRRLLKRISASHTAISRTPESKREGEMVATILADYRSFSLCFYEFLKSELGGYISYQRHILGLHSLRYFIDHVIDPEIYKYDSILFKSLTSLVLDPFEDVRGASASLLKALGMQTRRALAAVIDEDLIASVRVLAVDTVRGDHAEGLGKLWALSDTLNEKSAPTKDVQTQGFSSSNLSELLRLQRDCLSKTTTLGSSSRFPIHGSLLSLSYRLQDMKSQAASIPITVQSAVLDDCITIWGMVRPVLCVDSPETAYEAEDGVEKEGPKDLLAYSWRALRDSSLLMQSLLMAVELESPLHSVIGNICMDQLISLRHRGAFSTVAQTFGICCDRARLSSSEAIRALIQEWYKVSLIQIDKQGDRLTRRSAGLPAMFSALLSPGDPSFFSVAVLKLIALAETTSTHIPEDEQKLPQVHALNCLKEILTTSRFSAIVMQFLNPILELAAASLSSSVWAIRNCGLMLLKACINRLSSKGFEHHSPSGTERPQLEIRDTPSKIAVSLLRIADEEMEAATGSGSKSAETIFSALDLLGHTTLPEAKNSIVDNAIHQHLHHPNWAVRDHAALLLSRRLSIKSLSLSIRAFRTEVGSVLSQNTAHGVLLCFRYILNASQNYLQQEELDNALTELAKLTNNLGNASSRSPYVQAAIFDILNDASALILENQWPPEGLVNVSTKELTSSSPMNSLHAPYLHRRLRLFQVYTLLLSKNLSALDLGTSSLIHGLVSNQDSLSYVMEILTHSRFWPKAPQGVAFLAYLLRSLHREPCVSPDVLDAVTSCLVDGMDKLSTSALPEICSIIGMIDFEKPSTREGMNAAVRVEAYRLFSTVNNQNHQEQPQAHLNRWVSMVEFASMDLLDFPTRWSAARALSTHFRLVQEQPDSPGSLQVRLRSMMVLYNLLNDDDEDVRSEASSAATGLLGLHGQRGHALGLSAMAAREYLLDQIVERNGKTTGFAESAVMRIMLLRETASENSGMHTLGDVFASPVSLRLHRLLLAKDDLFAEESQNLYIDDIREVEIWRGCLRGCIDQFTQQQVDLITGWALEGLQSVLDCLWDSRSVNRAAGGIERGGTQMAEGLQVSERTSFTMHPFGPTYDADLLVVFVKVISIAGVICRRSKGIEQEQLLERLARAQRICRDGLVNEVFVKAVNEALIGL